MLKDILSIAGQTGLWKLVSQSAKGIIVENIETGKRIPAFHTSKVSALEDIAIYTENEEIALADVFEKISKLENKGATSISHKASNDEVKEYFGDVLPEYDKERVYISDMKKVIGWYNLLHKQNLLDFSKKKVKEETEKVEAELQEVAEAK